jgi:hypothetical protein
MTENEETRKLALEIHSLRQTLVTVEALIVDTVEDLGRANFKFCNDADYAGPVARKRQEQMTAALDTIRRALKEN